MTKKDLYELFWMKKNINRLEEKLLELENKATQITTQLSKEPKGTNSVEDKLGETVSKIVDLQNEINDQLKIYYKKVRYIEKAIEKLPPREALLIRLRYLDQKRWEEICVEMNYSWRQIHYIHAEALKMLA
jgi:DNA-directed RNA polymerase specialized sigma subunit